MHHVHVLLGMVEELVVATVTYPLVVLDRRMCVDVSACPSDEANARETLLTALAVCACVVAACCDGVPSAIAAFSAAVTVVWPDFLARRVPCRN